MQKEENKHLIKQRKNIEGEEDEEEEKGGLD